MMAFLMGLPSLSPADVHALVTRRAATVIDVNARARWLEARVPGAVNLDHAAYAPGDLPPAKDARLVFYCSNPMCRKAPIAARRARGMGYANAVVMSAGISGWLAARLPVESGV
jgi:rhodanese-related sulfurtransferase